MADYNISRIEKDKHWKIAPLKSGRGNRQTYVIGFDSEAERGTPFLFQFAHPNGNVDLIEVPKKKWGGLYAFFDYLEQFCATATAQKTEYVVFGFNLPYEWTQLFRDLTVTTRSADEFEVTLQLPSSMVVKIRATNNKRYYLTCELGKTKRRFKVVDARAFIVGSLNSVSELLGIGRKVELDSKVFKRSDMNNPTFIEYAKQDAILTQKVGEYIISLHKEFDVRTCISAPHWASSVFRRKFLLEEIPQCFPELEQIGLYTYHGGKNGFYLDKPAFIENVWYIDIRSAYPEAMAQLPDITKGSWREFENYVPHTHSIWKIKARLNNCKFRCLQTIKGEWITERGIEIETYCTGYEIDTAIAMGDIDLISASGFIYDGPAGGPFVDYVTHFYSLKRNARNAAEKLLAKLALNSLYGKLFQKVPLGDVGIVNVITGETKMTNPAQQYDFRAGGLYHPAFAALITGFVRAKIHGLEHKYDSIATSTDGIFAYNSPADNDIGEELGQLDAQQGSLRIYRERDYIFTPSDGSKRKYAYHGFRGSTKQFESIPLEAGIKFEYKAKQMITLRQSKVLHDGKKFAPGQFVKLPYEFVIPENNEVIN